MSLRDQLLDHTGGPTTTVDVDGSPVELRCPSRERARHLGRKVESKETWSEPDLDLLFVIEAAHDPEDGERVFEHADLPTLRSMPMSQDHWLSTLVDETLKLLGQHDTPEEEALERVDGYLEDTVDSIIEADPDDVSESAKNQITEALLAAREVCQTALDAGGNG